MGNIVGLVIAVAVGGYLYTDSKKIGMGNPILWGVLGFLFSLITAIVYFIMRSNHMKQLEGGGGGQLPPQG